MGKLSELLSFIAGKYAALVVAIQASKVAQRWLLVAYIGGIYVACVKTFSDMVAPWFSGLLQAGGATGATVGLLFPPVSGTVLASLLLFWTCVVSVRYLSKLSIIVFKD